MTVIAISRQYGAGGKTLGEMVAKKLGYTFVDDEIIKLMAEKAGVSTESVESFEREAGGKLLRFISRIASKKVVDKIMDQKYGYLDVDSYVAILQQIIIKIADEGNCVIVGRGGQYILRNRKDALCILLVAHKNDRVKFMEKHYKLTPLQASQKVSAEDRRRKILFRKFGIEDYDSTDLYHLVVNRSKMPLEMATDMVCNLADLSF